MTADLQNHWKQDSQSFDSVAELYDARRPQYPQELVETVISLSNLPSHGRILEVGSGTGKATSLFARRGYAMLCLEPGRSLTAVARGNLRDCPKVEFECIRFEDWKVRPGHFDLVISAQAFHWVPKEVGYARAAQALKPHGCLALFWNLNPGLQEPLSSTIEQVYRECAPELTGNDESFEQTTKRRQAEIEESGCFDPVVQKRFPWVARYDTDEYLGLLNTYSDHLRLPEANRQHLFSALARVIDAQGGFIERPYVAVLYVAKKKE